MPKDKIRNISEVEMDSKLWKKHDEKIVFTNGVFDILHKGHCAYLLEAARLGNRLVIGLNSDASVKRLGKGDDRPLNDQEARAFVLSCLSFVDAIVIFNEDTPLELIQKIKPNVLVKGGDYNAEEKDQNSKKYIVGSDIVLDNRGEVRTIDLVDGYSTTALIEKMKNG